MNPLKKAICGERYQVKRRLGSNNPSTLVVLPLPFSPLSSLSLTPRPNPENAEYNMIFEVGWHGASRPVVVVVRVDARFYEEKRTVLGELTLLLCKVKKARLSGSGANTLLNAEGLGTRRCLGIDMSLWMVLRLSAEVGQENRVLRDQVAVGSECQFARSVRNGSEIKTMKSESRRRASHMYS